MSTTQGAARAQRHRVGAPAGEAKEELFNLRFQNATGQLDNIARIPHMRRDIARIETLLRERENRRCRAAREPVEE